MKRGKYDEKILGPIFPRLHVNDTERGGLRAPPRNKMALYEQLTIPSYRYNPGNMHLNPSSCSSLVPTGTSSQGTSRERSVYFPLYRPPPTPSSPSSHSADRLQRLIPGVVNLRSLASQAEQRRKPEDEDDFAVPIFSEPEKEQFIGPQQIGHDVERCQAFSSSLVRLPNACDKVADQANSESLNLRQDREDQHRERTRTLVADSDPTIKYSTETLARESSDGALQIEEFALMDSGPDANKASRLKYCNVDSRCNGSKSSGPIKEAEVRISSRSKSNSHLGISNRNEFDFQDEGDQIDNTLAGAMDRDDDVSMVATISGSDISPDDVVDVIGLKHFWKARRAIVDQQRVLAVQVFELHRLIKVQKLIAKSPEILIEACTFLGKSSIKATPLKKIPSSYAVKALADSNKKDDSQKTNHTNKMEATAENTLAKAPTASSTWPLSHQPFPVIPAFGSQATTEQPPVAAPHVATDPQASPWPFPLPGGHQWLVPVMSPSEGLVYKPYAGPGFAGPVCGGCGPHGTAPVAGHFINPNYGVSPSHYYHHQGVPFSIQGYFPAYGMPMMNSALSGSAVDQINQLSGSNPNGGTGQAISGMPNFIMQQQGSCNIPSQRHSELLGSTGSSPSERAHNIVGAGPVTKEKDALTLFPPAPLTEALGVAPQPHETDQPTSVIKVVPHNARTATESAARIFRSIQEERRQHQSS